MMGGTRERIGLFIDGANLSATLSAINLRIDYNQFLNYFRGRDSYITNAWYFTAIWEERDGNKPLMDLVTYLQHQGYYLVMKPAKSYFREGQDDIIKGNMDIEMCCAVWEAHETIDRIVLVTGDGDFAHLVRKMRDRGKRVTIVSSKHTNGTTVKHPLVSTALIRAANDFVDLADPKIVKSIRKE